MSFKDIIKSSVYENFAGGTGMTFVEVLLILVAACVVGLYIYMVYRTLARSEFYSRDLNVTMAGMTVVVAAIMIAMQSNLVVSLGMVGALSIVRFRTAVKNPIDLLYLFWAISAGIICGVELYILSAVLCVAMTVLIILLSRIPVTKAPQLLVMRAGEDVDTAAVEQVIHANSKYSSNKSSMLRNHECEMIYEINAADPVALSKALYAIPGVTMVNLLEHSGELRG